MTPTRSQPNRDKPATPSHVMRVPEVATLLGVGQSAVRKAIQRGQLPVLYVGRRVLLPRAAVVRLLEEGQAAPQVPSSSTVK